MTPQRHILGTFDQALEASRNDVLVMGSLATRSLQNAMNGLLRRDEDLCRAVIADDEEIDELEKQVDRDGFDIILRFQPLASDLRSVISAMKISANLERIGDQAVSIARRARRLCRLDPLPEARALEPLFLDVLGMFTDSLRAFGDGDEETARNMKERDRHLDALCHELDHQLSERMAQNPGAIEGYLALIFVSRNLERVGDHSTNIAEDVVYMTNAEDIRHQRPSDGEPL